MLKRIGDNPYSVEKSAPPEMNWGIRERCFEEGKQAQLEADQREVESIVEEIIGEMETYHDKQIRQCDMGRERLEPYKTIEERVAMERYEAEGIGHRRSKNKLQALKQDILRKVRGEK